MVAVIYAFLLLSSLVMGVFGFWVGRCARKLPIIDNNLPWTLHRDQIPSTAGTQNESRVPPRALGAHLTEQSDPSARLRLLSQNRNPADHTGGSTRVQRTPHHALRR
jgi:hypothetical protein